MKHLPMIFALLGLAFALTAVVAGITIFWLLGALLFLIPTVYLFSKKDYFSTVLGIAVVILYTSLFLFS